MKKYVFIVLILSLAHAGYAQTTNDILNVLVQRKLVAQDEADSLRADAAIKQQDSDAKKKSFLVTAGRNIQLSSYTQVRYQNLEESGKKSGFDIRRARLDIKGTISPIFSYRLQPEFAGSSARLLDAFAEIKLSDYFNLTIGQQKVSLSLESQAADNKYDFIDRAVVVESLVGRSKDVIGGPSPTTVNNNGRDLGIQINGSFLKINDHSIIDYWVGLFNGAGINVAENNNTKDLAGRLVLHPISGLDLGGSVYNGVGNYKPDTISTHKVADFTRKRWGVELKYELKNFLFQAEFLKGKDGVKTEQGYYLEGAYFILPQKLQFLAKIDSYNPNKLKKSVEQYTYFAGINYSFNPNARLQIGYDVKQQKATTIHKNYAVAQFLIGF